MTIKECIDIVDNAKPNQYSVKDKVAWLSFIDEIIINDVLKTHEGYDKRYDDFKGYTEDKLSVPLIVKNPYDRLYVAYLKMMIDKENGETARYNNSATTYNTYLLEFKKYYNKTHLPLSNVRIPTKNATGASDKDISEAQLESLKNVVYALLRNDLDDIISDDKLYDIVMKYVLNNADMLKGKDGKDGADGKDGVTGKSLTYKDLTEAEKADFLKDVYTRYFIDNSIKALEDKIEDGKTIAKEDLERFRQSIYTDLESKASVKFVREALETKAEKEFVDDIAEVIANIMDAFEVVQEKHEKKKVIDVESTHDTYPSTKAVFDLVSKNYYRQKINLKDVTTIANNYAEDNTPTISADFLDAASADFDINVDGFIKFKFTTDNAIGIVINGEEKVVTSNDGEFSFESVVHGKITIKCNLSSVIFTEFYKITGDVADALGAVHSVLDEILAIKAKLWGDVE